MAVQGTAVIRDPNETADVWESIVDMGGEGAAYSPFSKVANLVLSFRLAGSLGAVDGTAAVREGTLRAAGRLTETTRGLDPPEFEVLELGAVDSGLPRVAYICFMLGLTSLHTTYVYGSPITSLPTLLHPNELADGAVVSANYHIAGIRNPTYGYQNNPIIGRLMAEHGRTVDFVGVIVAQATISLYQEKERSALQAAKLARMLGAEAAVLSLDNGGNAFSDLMLACRACERLGIRTSLVMPEYAGAGGAEPAFVDFVPEAVAIASTGNVDAAVTLPAIERVIGGTDFPPSQTGSEPPIMAAPAESFGTTLRLIQGATSGLGIWRLGGRAS
jgi:glycine reductase